MLFDIRHLARIDEIARMPGFEEAGFETAQAVLEECAKFNEGVVAPLNVEGDRNPSTWKDGRVSTTPGFKQAYAQYAEGGWQGLQHPVDFGGQGLPKTDRRGLRRNAQLRQSQLRAVPAAHRRRDRGATDGRLGRAQGDLPGKAGERAVDRHHEPDRAAGRLRLGLVRTRAEPQPDGSFKIFGTKIFITYGEHDMAENIVHLVLARVTGAPEGVKGISLFVVPKFLVGKDGKPGARNDVHCVSIEHKLGIKASPTAVLEFGDGTAAKDVNGTGPGAVGYLVGQENRGLEYMFIMMNAARYAVGVQGIAISERAYQMAVEYAKDRVQSRPVDGSMNASAPDHPPPRRASACS